MMKSRRPDHSAEIKIGPLRARGTGIGVVVVLVVLVACWSWVGVGPDRHSLATVADRFGELLRGKGLVIPTSGVSDASG